MIGYWLQIIMGSSSKLSYQIYKYVLHLDMQNIYSTQWIRKIKEILQRCGLFHIWVNQHSIRIEDSKAIRLLICTRINDQYEQTWHSSIPTHIRCSYYVLFKDNRKLEPYLYKLSTSNRIYLSKFRCRSNYMPVSKVYKHADTYSLSARILHRAPPPRLQVDQNFLTQKIVADPKMRCHQKSFGIWRVTEAILGQKACFFSKNIFWKKFIINHTIF